MLYFQTVFQQGGTICYLRSGIEIHYPFLTGKRLIKEMEKPLDVRAWCIIGLINDGIPWACSKGDDKISDYVYMDLVEAR